MFDLAMYYVGHGQGLGMAILGAEAPVARKDLHEGRRPMAVAHRLMTDETVKEDAELCWTVLTWLG